MSRNVLGNSSITRFDALVIGSGAGGGTITAMLTAHGKKVLVLEAGACHFDHLDDPARDPVSRFSNDELKLAYRNWVYPDLTAEPRTWRTSEADGVRLKLADVNGLPKTVGGGAVHADLKMPRFLPQDFHLGSALGTVTGASFADWPIDYDVLEPYYLWAERICGVQGAVVGYPDEPWRSAPFPMPPGLPMYCATKVVAGAESIGLHPFPYPAAVNSRPYGGRPACVDCGFCSGFGCPNNSKGSPPVTTLRQALLSGNCLLLAETRVVKLLPDSAGTAIAGVEAIGPDGRRVTYHADAYVLAASPIEDARLLFLSDPAGLGNSSGQVGRNLMFHLQTNAIGIWEERLHGFRGRTVTHGFSDFRGVPNDASRPLGGIVEISGSEGVLQEAMFIKQIYDTLGGYDGTRFKAMMRQSPTRDRVVALAMQAEDAPQPTNRVDLDPDIRDLDRLPVARVTYANHPFELTASDFYGPKLLQLLGASGARWAVPAPRDEIPASAHIMGTLRFGTDPATSVCDVNGRFHDLGNLYAADGSLFPTSSGFNPTLTIMALAARVGAAMIYPSNPDLALG